MGAALHLRTAGPAEAADLLYRLEQLGENGWMVVAACHSPAIAYAAYYAALGAEPDAGLALTHEGRRLAIHPEALWNTPRPRG